MRGGGEGEVGYDRESTDGEDKDERRKEMVGKTRVSRRRNGG